MGWIVIVLILLVCAFLLIGRVYTSKGKKGDETAQSPDEATNGGGEAENG